MFFSTLPTVAEGFSLQTWRGVPEADMPALSPVARTPRRDTTGRITNAVLILHGTSGTGWRRDLPTRSLCWVSCWTWGVAGHFDRIGNEITTPMQKI
jgi:hypothetical protein